MARALTRSGWLPQFRVIRIFSFYTKKSFSCLSFPSLLPPPHAHAARCSQNPRKYVYLCMCITYTPVTTMVAAIWAGGVGKHQKKNPSPQHLSNAPLILYGPFRCQKVVQLHTLVSDFYSNGQFFSNHENKKRSCYKENKFSALGGEGRKGD